MKHLKTVILLFLLCSSYAGIYAQCTPLVFNSNDPQHTNLGVIMSLNIKDNFCAIGDGSADDQPAFDAAGAFIRARGGYCKLLLPDGTYRVGQQYPDSNNYYKYGSYGLNIFGCMSTEIVGEGGARMFYKDHLMYGYFDSSGTPLNSSTTLFGTRIYGQPG